MKVTGLTIDPFTNMPIVILKDEDESLALPIWIGLIEASSIATELKKKIQLSRPMTHDLIKTLLKDLKAKVHLVEIVDLADNTFFSVIRSTAQDGRELTLDLPPSDALAIALRTEAPIFVDRIVIEKSRKLESNNISEDQMQAQKWQRFWRT